MSINQTLLIETEPYLNQYDCEKHEVERFLSRLDVYELPGNRQPFQERKRTLVAAFSAVMEPHGKKHLFDHISQLAQIEDAYNNVNLNHRDHVIHALLTFILGIYINEIYWGKIGNYTADKFQWEIASLFHDIGYTAEFANYTFQQYFKYIKPTVSGAPFLPPRFHELSKRINGLHVIQRQLNIWNLDIDVESEYRRMFKETKINHGIISSLTILKRIDALYQKKNPERLDYYEDGWEGINYGQKCFEQDIVPACSAIFLHSLDRRCFKNTKIRLSETPIAFLLKLSDSLQEWNRPSIGRKTFPSTAFDICVKRRKLIIHADIPNEIKTHIMEDISCCLDEPGVEIQ